MSDTVEAACAAARAAYPQLRDLSRAARAEILEAIATAIDEASERLVVIAHEETHLPPERLRGEVTRTTGQLRLFADVLTDGGYLEATIDRARPDATPPRPDLRRMLVPLGPVAVFSASNFPFAFSVVGGDTASALAAGCPVVVKAHSAHLRLSREVAAIASAAAVGAGAPEGTLSLVEGREEGVRLVQDPRIRAVGFTGSLHGGRALFDLASARPDPIPFYGELGSTNPVVITAAALAERSEELARGLVGSFTLGVGQFCTKPGVVLVPAGSSSFTAQVAAALEPVSGGLMLSDGIASAFEAGTGRLQATPGVRVIGSGAESEGATPIVFAVDAATALAASGLLDECFGPTTVIVEYRSNDEVRAVLEVLEGALTGTIHAGDGEDTGGFVEIVREHVGRLLFGGWPTGVAVAWSQHHGGPWPATTNALHTSVGASSIRRFLRPLAFQDAPESALPADLRDEPSAPLPRRIDGALVF
jgi:NADP-dependent aldehyde dehydrogenase